MSDVSVRKVGVEEELMLVDPESWELTAVSQKAVRAHQHGSHQLTVEVEPAESDVAQELFLQQIETMTPPCTELGELMAEIRRCRRAAGEAARSAGAVAVAMPTPVLVDPDEHVTPKPRYQRIYDEYGEMTRQSLVCAMHVHVDVDGDEEAVTVLDGIRPWLPVLLAISGNSPFWRGHDTGFASWRSQIWSRWPTSGPAEPFGDPMTYRETSRRLIEWGAALDPGMLYFDTRLSENYPTIEIRVADVCTEVEDAALVAGLSRALVQTAAQTGRAADDADAWRSDLLRAATWRAARYGVAGRLVHPVEHRLAPAREVFECLLEHVAPALDQAGDSKEVQDAFNRLMTRGTGAARQRAALEAGGSLASVVRDLAQRTQESWAD